MVAASTEEVEALGAPQLVPPAVVGGGVTMVGTQAAVAKDEEGWEAGVAAAERAAAARAAAALAVVGAVVVVLPAWVVVGWVVAERAMAATARVVVVTVAEMPVWAAVARGAAVVVTARVREWMGVAARGAGVVAMATATTGVGKGDSGGKCAHKSKRSGRGGTSTAWGGPSVAGRAPQSRRSRSLCSLRRSATARLAPKSSNLP
jgi:hypothetical protein